MALGEILLQRKARLPVPSAFPAGGPASARRTAAGSFAMMASRMRAARSGRRRSCSQACIAVASKPNARATALCDRPRRCRSKIAAFLDRAGLATRYNHFKVHTRLCSFSPEGKMRTIIPLSAATVLVLVVSSSFSYASSFHAHSHNAAKMTGSDATYHSTGKCVRGDCLGKTKAKLTAAQ